MTDKRYKADLPVSQVLQSLQQSDGAQLGQTRTTYSIKNGRNVGKMRKCGRNEEREGKEMKTPEMLHCPGNLVSFRRAIEEELCTAAFE